MTYVPKGMKRCKNCREPEDACDCGVPSGRIHMCSWCDKQDVWTETWWSLGTMDEPIFAACSDECLEHLKPFGKMLGKPQNYSCGGAWLKRSNITHAEGALREAKAEKS